MSGISRLTTGPVVATAIHDGHVLRCALGEHHAGRSDRDEIGRGDGGADVARRTDQEAFGGQPACGRSDGGAGRRGHRRTPSMPASVA